MTPTPVPTAVAAASPEPSTQTPTVAPSISPAPTITAQPSFTPFECNICGANQTITEPNATVVVPLMGSMSCQELQTEASVPGAYDNLQCLLFQIVSLPCQCEPISPDAIVPTPSPLSTLPPDDPPPAQSIEDGDDENTGEDENVPEECQYLLVDASNLIPVDLTIQFDNAPTDIGWYIADSQLLCYRLGVPAGAYQADTVAMTETIPLVGGVEYVFVIESAAGDGLAGGSGGAAPGSYNLTAFDGNITLASGGGNFGSEERNVFIVPSTMDVTP